MALFTRQDSPFWWALLEGTGRKKVNTRIPHEALTAEGRKALKIAAEAIYHQHMVNHARRKVGLPVATSLTFNQLADWYEKHVIPTHDGAKNEMSILRTLRAFYGQTVISEIRPSLVAEYEAVRLAKGRKRSTVHREISILRNMLNRAVGEHLDTSPLAGLRQRKQKSRPKRTIAGSEEPALLKALAKVDPELHDLYVVGVGTLLRQENLATLKRRQLRGTSLVVDTKTGPHTVDLSGPTELQTRARDVLLKRLPKDHDGLFFPVWGPQFLAYAATGKDDPRSRFLLQVRKAFTTVGLPWGLDNGGLVWHSATRASGATRLLREYQVDVRTVQLMGPWSSLDQMAEYLGFPPGASFQTPPKQTGTRRALTSRSDV